MAETETISMIVSFFRFSAISIFLLLGAIFLRDFTNRQTAWLGAWASVAGATYLICTNPTLRELAGPTMPFIEVFCHSGQLAIWLFSLSQFRDRLNIWPNYALIALVFYLLGRLSFDVLDGTGAGVEVIVDVLYALARFGLIAHMIYVAWEGRDADLLEARRTFRLIYIFAVTITTLAIVSVETFFEPGELSGTPIILIQSIGLWVLAVTLAWFGINLRTVAFIGGRPDRSKAQAAEGIDPGERHDLETIERLIEEDKLYLKSGLTIAGLAGEASLPEHRLRRLINRHLGYRNFADFLNHYRITAAQERLASVQERNIPVLTIAMDLGYGSLGPFNRAFKERTGLTPTEYRKKQLAET